MTWGLNRIHGLITQHWNSVPQKTFETSWSTTKRLRNGHVSCSEFSKGQFIGRSDPRISRCEPLWNTFPQIFLASNAIVRCSHPVVCMKNIFWGIWLTNNRKKWIWFREGWRHVKVLATEQRTLGGISLRTLQNVWLSRLFSILIELVNPRAMKVRNGLNWWRPEVCKSSRLTFSIFQRFLGSRCQDSFAARNKAPRIMLQHAATTPGPMDGLSLQVARSTSCPGQKKMQEMIAHRKHWQVGTNEIKLTKSLYNQACKPLKCFWYTMLPDKYTSWLVAFLPMLPEWFHQKTQISSNHKSILWVVPLPSNSDHQDYFMFGRGFL